MGVYEETETDCCRLVAPEGPTAWTEQENCTMLPLYTCFQNPHNKIKTANHVGQDPGACCAACNELEGCVSWTHSPGSGGSCNLYSNVGPTKSNDRDGCSAGTIGGHGRPMPVGPFPPAPAPHGPPSPTPQPATPRGDKPNILFLVVESTDGRTWSPGYQNDVVKLPNFRALQEGGLNFRRHYANAPVCCPSRATFWSGRHASNLAHLHPGYGDIHVPGALNNFEGLPGNFSHRIDQVLPALTDYKVKVSGKTDWSTGGHSENVRLDAWTMCECSRSLCVSSLQTFERARLHRRCVALRHPEDGRLARGERLHRPGARRAGRQPRQRHGRLPDEQPLCALERLGDRQVDDRLDPRGVQGQDRSVVCLPRDEHCPPAV